MKGVRDNLSTALRPTFVGLSVGPAALPVKNVRFYWVFLVFTSVGMSGFSLPDGGAIDDHAMRGHIFNLQTDYMQPRSLLSMARLNMAKSRVRFST